MLITTLLLVPWMVSATTLEFYRSALCDKQRAGFYLDRYNTLSLYTDTACRLTPARTIAMRSRGGIDDGCFVLAYGDRACGHDTLIGVVPSTGTCLASTKMKMGSWEAVCRYSDHNSSSTNYSPGELKRTAKLRTSVVDQEAMIDSEDVSRSVVELATTESCETATSMLAVSLHEMVKSMYSWISKTASSVQAKWSRLMTRIRQSTVISPSGCMTKQKSMSTTAATGVFVRVNGADRNLASLTPSIVVSMALTTLFMR